MDSSTFASSQKEENDSAAKRRWENKGKIRGNSNSYPVIIERKTPQPVRRKAR
jgi:hypothetical protein